MTNHIQSKLSKLIPDDYSKKYKVDFVDGQSLILSGTDTLKLVHIKWKEPYRNIPVAEAKEYLTIKHMSKVLYTPLPEPTEFTEKNFVISPYIMGALLGDGGLSVRSNIRFSSADEEMIQYINADLPEDLELVKVKSSKYDYYIRIKKGSKTTRISFNIYLKLIGLKVTSERKFIPREYFEGAISQRLQLLQGLIDTDGFAGKLGHIVFYTCSPRLASDCAELVRSLGGIARVSNKQTYFVYNGTKKKGLPSYAINIRMKNPSSVCRLTRKKNRLPEKNQYSDWLKLKLKNITEYNE